MSDLDAIRGRIRKSMSQQGIPVMEPEAVVMYYPVRGPDLDDLLAALATAEEEVDKIGRVMCRTVNDLTAQVQALQARADAAERRGEEMRGALKDCHGLLSWYRHNRDAIRDGVIVPPWTANDEITWQAANVALARGEGEGA